MSISIITPDATGGGASSIVASGVVAELATEFATPVVLSPPPPKMTIQEGTHVETSLNVPISKNVTWSHSKEREFTRLAALRALGKATVADLNALQSLRTLRRAKKNPVPAAEIIFQFRRREMEKNLLTELHRYVAFLETPRRS